MSALPPECRQWLISGYVLGNLSPGEATLFAEMLAEDPSLNAEIAQMQEALNLAYDPPEVPPPNSLRDRILAAANTETPAAERQPKARPKLILSGNKILGAIALAIITILGITNYRLWRTVQTTNRQITAGKQLIYQLSSSNLNQESRAELIVSPEKLRAVLTVTNLPPLTPDKAYALWTVVGKDVPYTTDSKGAILTAVFQVNESGSFKQQIAVPQPYLEPETIQTTAITVEEVSAPQNHLGQIVISSGN